MQLLRSKAFMVLERPLDTVDIRVGNNQLTKLLIESQARLELDDHRGGLGYLYYAIDVEVCGPQTNDKNR